MTDMKKLFEQQEHLRLDNKAAFSDETRGRLRPEPEQENDVRTAFQRDTDRIVHCKSFRRLMHKTQVFLNPEGDHYRTRMTHTIEVARIARTIARALNLNEDLAEAIAMGHDLGHTPFGHAGEGALSACIGHEFRHNEQSLRVVDVLEKDGQGLNLTYEVRMGILGHTGARIPETLEGQIVRRSDQIAYVNHDIDDAIRAGILKDSDIPRSICITLGDHHSQRINTLVCDMILSSREAGSIVLSPAVDQALKELRAFMFEKVYRNPIAKGQEIKAQDMLKRLYEYYFNRPEALPEDFQPQLSFDGMERTVCDYIAGMTDNYAVDKYTELFIPMGWHVRG
ncbi:MAG: deoxyguanosinetriphosphate triphosphohydrolase [Oscillospiraceae bacterium]|nr:deoxyguanosinetriphosphate triphosphohydrolase [Oscillospiraceae bacterium]